MVIAKVIWGNMWMIRSERNFKKLKACISYNLRMIQPIDNRIRETIRRINTELLKTNIVLQFILIKIIRILLLKRWT